MRGLAPWVALAAATGAAGWALGAVGLPSSFLFGALLLDFGLVEIAPDLGQLRTSGERKLFPRRLDIKADLLEVVEDS